MSCHIMDLRLKLQTAKPHHCQISFAAMLGPLDLLLDDRLPAGPLRRGAAGEDSSKIEEDRQTQTFTRWGAELGKWLKRDGPMIGCELCKKCFGCI